jgi:hypothetical protein
MVIDCVISSGRAVVGVLDDRGSRSSGGTGIFCSFDIDRGVGVVGDDKGNVDGCGVGDKDEKNRG